MIIYQSRQVAETNNLTITSGMATNEGDKKKLQWTNLKNLD